MKNFIVGMVLHLVLILGLEKIWFSFAGSFLKRELSSIALIENNQFQVRLNAAILVYLIMAFSLQYFVFALKTPEGLFDVLTRSATLGFVVYGVFDLTNRAILRDYSWSMAIVDMFWGVFLYSAVGLISFYILGKLKVIN